MRGLIVSSNDGNPETRCAPERDSCFSRKSESCLRAKRESRSGQKVDSCSRLKRDSCFAPKHESDFGAESESCLGPERESSSCAILYLKTARLSFSKWQHFLTETLHFLVARFLRLIIENTKEIDKTSANLAAIIVAKIWHLLFSKSEIY